MPVHKKAPKVHVLDKLPTTEDTMTRVGKEVKPFTEPIPSINHSVYIMKLSEAALLPSDQLKTNHSKQVVRFWKILSIGLFATSVDI